VDVLCKGDTIDISIKTFDFGLSGNRLSFGGGKRCVSIGVNFILVWIVLQYDWWLRVRLCVCGFRVAVVAELSCSKGMNNYLMCFE
jgi:hypothetical protein